MLSLLLSALLPQTPAAQAPDPAPRIDCSATRIGFVGELAPWAHPVAPTPLLRPGIAYTTPHAAPLTIEIAEAGTYGFALDQGAWIDVARDGQALRSASHAHGPQCSGIHKIVDFALQPGRYTITFGRTQGDTLRLLVIRR